MKEILNFLKVFGLATVGTALMLVVAVLAASILSAYNKEIVVNIMISVIGASVVLPLFFFDKKEWVFNTSLILMAYVLIQSLMIMGLL